ncbi:MAG TPA: hypothetical protein P5560_03725 [Thermotogota bacterium]|nr:hypothetical protein [Thermotogota bacterium]HRW92039.1 hypothetical protein [Thermotogota bacterium]
MKAKWVLLGVLLLAGGALFGMAFEIGTGYRFVPSSFANHGWNLDTGLWNDFNDILQLDVTYQPFFGDYSPEEASPTNYFNFDLDLYIPLLGRQQGMGGYRFGLFSTFEFGNFYDQFQVYATDTTSSQQAWENSSFWFGAGVYGQFYFDPWMFRLGVGIPIMQSPSTLSTLDLLIGTLEMNVRYFIQSQRYSFNDYFTVDIQVSSRKIGLSVTFIEPF